MAQVEENKAKPKHSINDFLKKPSLILLGLGFSAGMPNLLAGTSWVMGTWLRDSGATLAIIGLVGLVTLSYALKFLWAPLIDRISFPFLDEKLGRRRSWILITQIISMIFLFLIAFTDPAKNLNIFVTFLACLAFTGSCQDIAIDAYRIEASEDTEQLGVLTTMYQFGYRIAFILAGAAPLYIAQFVNGNDYSPIGWTYAYGAMGCLMVFPIIATLAANREKTIPTPRWQAPEDLNRNIPLEIIEWVARLGIFALGAVFLATGLSGKAEASHWLLGGFYGSLEHMKEVLAAKPWGVWQQVGYAFFGLFLVFIAAKPIPNVKTVPSAYFQSAFGEPLADYFKRFENFATLILVFICVYRISEFLLNITGPLYLDAGFTKAEIATSTKIFGVIMLTLGTALAGWGILRFGLFKCLLIGAFTQPLSNLAFILVSYYGNTNYPFFEYFHIQPYLWLAIGIDNISTSFAGTALIVYMSSLTKVGFTATQYALFSSLYALPGKLIAAMSGRVIESAAKSSGDGIFSFLAPLFNKLPEGSFVEAAKGLDVTPAAMASGYAVFFIYTAAMGIFGVILAFIVSSGKAKELVEKNENS